MPEPRREVYPRDYLLTVKSFTTLQRVADKYESGVFAVGDHKWKLILYPSGDSKSNGTGYISLYLAIAETENYEDAWSVSTHFKLFAYDYQADAFIVFEDVAVKRYHQLKKSHGFRQLISQEEFSKKCLDEEDTCRFGVEICLINGKARTEETFSLVKLPPFVKDIKFRGFKHSKKYCIVSEDFSVGKSKWNLKVYPKGDKTGKEKSSFSIFLMLADLKELPDKMNVYADYKIGIHDIFKNTYKVQSEISRNWFSANSGGWGWASFMKLTELYDESNGYLAEGDLNVKVTFFNISEIK